MAAARHPVKFLRLAAMPILQQLQLEEALLRATTDNWFILNEGTPDPTIVMGVSGYGEDGRHKCLRSTAAVWLFMQQT